MRDADRCQREEEEASCSKNAGDVLPQKIARCLRRAKRPMSVADLQSTLSKKLSRRSVTTDQIRNVAMDSANLELISPDRVRLVRRVGSAEQPPKLDFPSTSASAAAVNGCVASEEVVCLICKGRKRPMLQCRRCHCAGHAICLKYEEMVTNWTERQRDEWTCVDCSSCCVCRQSKPTLKCASEDCEATFHKTCVPDGPGLVAQSGVRYCLACIAKLGSSQRTTHRRSQMNRCDSPVDLLNGSDNRSDISGSSRGRKPLISENASVNDDVKAQQQKDKILKREGLVDSLSIKFTPTGVRRRTNLSDGDPSLSPGSSSHLTPLTVDTSMSERRSRRITDQQQQASPALSSLSNSTLLSAVVDVKTNVPPPPAAAVNLTSPTPPVRNCFRGRFPRELRTAAINSSSQQLRSELTTPPPDAARERRLEEAATHEYVEETDLDVYKRSRTRMAIAQAMTPVIVATLAREQGTDPDKAKTPGSVRIGPYHIDAWYSSPYPREYALLPTVYVCEFCLAYMESVSRLEHHQRKCPHFHPPGKEIYRDTDLQLSLFEVDGEKATLFCTRLCYLAKMFLTDKTLFLDIEPFLFYVLVRNDRTGKHLVAAFSKQKYSVEGFNVACIFVLPPYQGKGYGHYLMRLSYLLSRVQKSPGTPEKPLSIFGQRAYESVQASLVKEYFLVDDKRKEGKIEDIALETGMRRDDVVYALRRLGWITVNGDKHIIVPDKRALAAHKKKQEQLESQNKFLRVKEDLLKWTPRKYPAFHSPRSHDIHFHHRTYPLSSASQTDDDTTETEGDTTADEAMTTATSAAESEVEVKEEQQQVNTTPRKRKAKAELQKNARRATGRSECRDGAGAKRPRSRSSSSDSDVSEEMAGSSAHAKTPSKRQANAKDAAAAKETGEKGKEAKKRPRKARKTLLSFGFSVEVASVRSSDTEEKSKDVAVEKTKKLHTSAGKVLPTDLNSDDTPPPTLNTASDVDTDTELQALSRSAPTDEDIDHPPVLSPPPALTAEDEQGGPNSRPDSATSDGPPPLQDAAGNTVAGGGEVIGEVNPTGFTESSMDSTNQEMSAACGYQEVDEPQPPPQPMQRTTPRRPSPPPSASKNEPPKIKTPERVPPPPVERPAQPTPVLAEPPKQLEQHHPKKSSKRALPQQQLSSSDNSAFCPPTTSAYPQPQQSNAVHAAQQYAAAIPYTSLPYPTPAFAAACAPLSEYQRAPIYATPTPVQPTQHQQQHKCSSGSKSEKPRSEKRRSHHKHQQQQQQHSTPQHQQQQVPAFTSDHSSEGKQSKKHYSQHHTPPQMTALAPVNPPHPGPHLIPQHGVHQHMAPYYSYGPPGYPAAPPTSNYHGYGKSNAVSQHQQNGMTANQHLPAAVAANGWGYPGFPPSNAAASQTWNAAAQQWMGFPHAAPVGFLPPGTGSPRHGTPYQTPPSASAYNMQYYAAQYRMMMGQ